MDIGFSAYFVTRENVLTLLEEALEKGITFFELPYEIPYLEIVDSGFFSEVKRFKDMGASFSLHGPWIETNLGSLFEEIRAFSRERILRSIDLAESLGLNPLIIHPGFSFFKEEEIRGLSKRYFFEGLAFVVHYAREKGVNLCMENIPSAFSFFQAINDFSEIKEKFALNICYDVGHSLILKNQKYVRSPEDSIIQEIKDYETDIIHVHLHNNYGKADDHLLYSGIFDIKKVLGGLRKASFKGRIVIESEDVERYGIEYLLGWLNSE